MLLQVTNPVAPVSLFYQNETNETKIVKAGFLRRQVTVLLVHLWMLQSYAPLAFHERINKRSSNQFKTLRYLKGIITVSNPSEPTEKVKVKKMFIDYLLLLLSSWCKGKANYRVIEDDLFHRWSSVFYH